MKFKRLLISLVVFTWVITACQSAAIPPTPVATIPPTGTPAPTNTIIPTAVIIAELGKPVSSTNWEITLIGVSLLKRGVVDKEVGGEVLPHEGTRFVAAGFKVKPIGTATSVNTQKIVMVDENGQPRGAYYLGTQDATQETDPFSISVARFLWMIGEEIDLTSEKYIHMIFEISGASLGKEISFKFDDVAEIPFTVE